MAAWALRWRAAGGVVMAAAAAAGGPTLASPFEYPALADARQQRARAEVGPLDIFVVLACFSCFIVQWVCISSQRNKNKKNKHSLVHSLDPLSAHFKWMNLLFLLVSLGVQ